MSNLPAKTEPLDRDTLLIFELLENYDNKQQAGIKAGFSPSYVRTSQYYNKFKSPQFIQKMQDVAITYGLTELFPLRLRLKHHALLEANRQADLDPATAIENEPKLRHMDKMIDRMLGFTDEPKAPSQVTINVQEIRVLHGQLIPDTGHKTQDVVDGHVVDSDE